MNSHRNLGINNKFTGGNLEKLSSGFRINRAGDDAAGLAISEKMRGQIRGLAMAENNTLNGISLIQTAEGGLNETHAILQRMRELAVQSSNGTYDEEVDRAQLDKEFQAIKSEIDRIASSTHYNGIKLLDGSLGQNTRIPAAIAFSSNGAMAPAAAMVLGTTSAVTFSAGNMNNLMRGDTVRLDFVVNNVARSFVHVITAEDLLTNPGGSTQAHGAGSDFVAAFRAAFAEFDINPAELGVVVNADGTLTIGGNAGGEIEVTARNNGFETFVGVGGSVTRVIPIDDVANPGGQLATQTVEATQVRHGENDSRTLTIAGAVSATDLKYLDIDGRRFQLVSDIRQLDQGNIALFVDTEGQLGTDDMNSVIGQLRSHGYNVRTDDGTQIIFEAGGAGRGLTFQIGANGGADQRVSLFVDAMDSTSLGIMVDKTLTSSLAATDIRTIDAANTAIEVITGATNMVSSQRAGLGALQNRLEHTMNNLGVSKENLTAAESVIRDVDMAKEMMEFTKNQILVQASQAMLAQANQLPQGVLSLLR